MFARLAAAFVFIAPRLARNHLWRRATHAGIGSAHSLTTSWTARHAVRRSGPILLAPLRAGDLARRTRGRRSRVVAKNEEAKQNK